MRGLLLLLLLCPALSRGAEITLDVHAREDARKGVYNDVRRALSAVEAASSRSGGGWTTLRVMPGVYWVEAPGDTAVRRGLAADDGVPFGARLKADRVHIIGMGASSSDVVWAVDRGQMQGAMGNYTMLRYEGRDLRVEHMTLGNYCNVSLDYPLDSALSRRARTEAVTQAQIALCYNADRVHLKGCRLVGYLNACPFVGSRRTLFEECYVECGDDALPGGAVMVGCRLLLHSPRPWYTTGLTGVYLLGCEVTSEVSGTQYFSKRGGPVTLFGTQLTGMRVTGWQTSAGADASVTYVRNTNVVSGGPGVNLGSARGKLVLADSSVYVQPGGGWNVRGLVDGGDGWNPTNQGVGLRKPTTLLLEPERQRARCDEGVMKVYFAGFYADGSEAFRGSQEVEIVNDDWRRKTKSVECEEEGLRGLARIIVEGRVRAAPVFERLPRLERRGPAWWVDYGLSAVSGLDAEGQLDESEVTWWRRTAGGDTVAISEGTGQARMLWATSGDVGCELLARVRPRLRGTRVGSGVTTAAVRCVEAQSDRSGFGTDFQTVAVRRSGPVLCDVWLMDTWRPSGLEAWPWEAGRGAGWSKDEDGLRLTGRGGRLRYVPEGVRSDTCEVALRVDPMKTGGQGFGSATGQWLDVVARYDTTTNSGVGMRLERRPESAKMVLMTPILYDRGVGRPIGPSKWTGLFRPGCVLLVRVVGEKMTCVVEQPSEGRRNGAECMVPLSDVVGCLVHHTGSLGEGGMTLRAANLTWSGVGIVAREAAMSDAN